MILDSLCSVKKNDFQEIFDDFFEIHGIDIKQQVSTEDIYKNFDIFKIHIKNPNDIDNLLLKIDGIEGNLNSINPNDIENLLLTIFEHITSFT